MQVEFHKSDSVYGLTQIGRFMQEEISDGIGN
jgi:hypothetical protein